MIRSDVDHKQSHEWLLQVARTQVQSLEQQLQFWRETLTRLEQQKPKLTPRPPAVPRSKEASVAAGAVSNARPGAEPEPERVPDLSDPLKNRPLTTTFQHAQISRPTMRRRTSIFVPEGRRRPTSVNPGKSIAIEKPKVPTPPKSKPSETKKQAPKPVMPPKPSQVKKTPAGGVSIGGGMSLAAEAALRRRNTLNKDKRSDSRSDREDKSRQEDKKQEDVPPWMAEMRRKKRQNSRSGDQTTKTKPTAPPAPHWKKNTESQPEVLKPVLPPVPPKSQETAAPIAPTQPPPAPEMVTYHDNEGNTYTVTAEEAAELEASMNLEVQEQEQEQEPTAKFAPRPPLEPRPPRGPPPAPQQDSGIETGIEIGSVAAARARLFGNGGQLPGMFAQQR